MSKLSLLNSKHTHRALGAIFGQMGVVTFSRSMVKAAMRARATGTTAGQQFHPALWEIIGDREAVVDGELRLTFREFRERVLRTADALHGLGLREGDACAVLLGNGVSWFEISQACNLSGYTMPMLNWHLKPAELIKCVERAGAKVLIVDREFLANVEQVREGLTVNHIVVVGDGPIPDGMKSLHELVSVATPTLHPGRFHIAAKAYSGGTTGTPKFINMDQAAMFGDEDGRRRGASREEAVRMTIMQLSALGWYGLGKLHDPITQNARSLIPGPLYHAGVQVAVLPFLFGGTVVPMQKFTPEGFLKAIQDERINWTFVAPTMLERVLALPDEIKGQYRLGSMRSLICAAAPCPPHIKQEINRLFRRQGAPDDVFHEYYGASETGIITILLPEDYQADLRRYRSVGKVRAAECRIYNLKAGRWEISGRPGAVLVRSALTFGLQYVGENQKTDECFLNIDGQFWYDDGLIGYLDDDGFLYLTSRAKEMIICGGVNIFPNEIEDVIKRHHSVLDVAVVRAPDPDLGEVPAAVVQLRENAILTKSELLAHCKDSGLYGFKLPRHVEFAALPRNLAGKLPKKELEDRFWRGVERIG